MQFHPNVEGAIKRLSIVEDETLAKEVSAEHTALITHLVPGGWDTTAATRGDLYDGPLLRFRALRTEGTTTTVCVTQDTSYREIVGLRQNSETTKTLPEDAIPLALSIMVIPVSKDGHTILVERDSGDWAHSLELPGKFIRVFEKGSGSDVVEEVLLHDLRVTRKHILNTTYLGALHYPEICEYMLIYKADLTEDAKMISMHAPKLTFWTRPGYSLKTHGEFFDLPLHVPTKTVAEILKKQRLYSLE